MKDSKTLTVEDINQAGQVIIKLVQEQAFEEEINLLRSLEKPQQDECSERTKASIKKGSSLYRLDPFLDDHGILRVGGRIKNSDFQYQVKHPIVLPRNSHITELIIKFHHERIQHQGRGMTLNDLRSSGYWIVGGTSTVGHYVWKCVKCRRMRGKTQEQKMADLPIDRLQPAPPFTFSAVDLFGPWYIKEGRKE
ncbi:hypothetical protein QZH41_000467 [Actinostola sp. cb2023]|nr:hypothetical protein QZH41_000467 [Actinostola sp. cb2023]